MQQIKSRSKFIYNNTVKKIILAFLLLPFIPLTYIVIVREIQNSQQTSCNLSDNCSTKRLNLRIGNTSLNYDSYIISGKKDFIFCTNSRVTEEEMYQIGKFLNVPEYANIVGLCLSLNTYVIDSVSIDPKSITYLSSSIPKYFGIYNLEAFYKRIDDSNFEFIDSLSEVVNYVVSSSQNFNKTLVCDTSNFKTQITLILNEKENRRNHLMY
jgi:hypothetical protein